MIPTKSQLDEMANLDPVALECTQYMLAELEHSREQLVYFIQRFENLITFYMAGLAALLSAVVVLLTSAHPPLAQKAALAVLGIGAWGFSIVLYARLCITRALMSDKITEERRNKEYFLSRHTHLRAYSNVFFPATSDPDNIKNWQGVAFSSQTIKFFHALILFVSFVAATTSVISIASIFEILGLPVWDQSGFQLGWYLIGGIGSWSLTMFVLLLILRAQRNQARKYIKWNLDELNKTE